MIFTIQFLNEAAERVIDKVACFAFIKHLSKGGKLGFFLLEQAQSGSNNLAGRGIAAAFQLRGNEGVKMFAEGDAGVLAHWVNPQWVPIIGTIGGHNKAVKPFAMLTRTFGTPRPLAHGFAMFTQRPLRTKRRLPGR